MINPSQWTLCFIPQICFKHSINETYTPFLHKIPAVGGVIIGRSRGEAAEGEAKNKKKDRTGKKVEWWKGGE